MSLFRFPHLPWAVCPWGSCLHTLLDLHISWSRLWGVDLHTKLNWRAAALKFHLILSFPDSDLHCETFSMVVLCFASSGSCWVGCSQQQHIPCLKGHIGLLIMQGWVQSLGSDCSSPQLLNLSVLETCRDNNQNLGDKFLSGCS